MTADAPPVALRRATPDDAAFLFESRNDPVIVARGTLQRTVTWDEHRAWLEATLAAPDRRLLYVVDVARTPAGVVRFDRDDAGATVSVYLVPSFTGKGVGVAAIQAGCAEARKAWGGVRVLACVRDDNEAGRRTFLRAGFDQADADLCPPEHGAFLLRP